MSASGFVPGSPSVSSGMISAISCSSVFVGAVPSASAASSTLRWMMKKRSRIGPRSPRTTSASSPVPLSSARMSWSTVIVVAVTEAIVYFVGLLVFVSPKVKNCMSSRKLSTRNEPPSVRVNVLAAALAEIVRPVPVSAGEVGSPGNGAVRAE